jgi:UDP-xylose/UDP-N-acetylglucosamine transporter B4
MNPVVPMAFVILGCGINVVFLELIVSAVKGAGNLITFAQFFFIATEGLIFTVDFGRKKPKIPLKSVTSWCVCVFEDHLMSDLSFLVECMGFWS